MVVPPYTEFTNVAGKLAGIVYIIAHEGQRKDNKEVGEIREVCC
jgi:hypothetical protein